ncbi:hypothetical protein EYB26_003565 [Talaromyces marneffei]|uniref:uncharacterized protein n=1 Tax=Talaromyces marneffei TaxID=37727 RepID=UPI0012A79B39|nr:uncharacterized protein EYB26_003565 [Talaromyces marneffei]QGA15904.1 hypothetical protein EYB26_003565 [Talaromyces marneffei]
MIESRSAKRRRVSDVVDQDGDVEIPETPPSVHDAEDEHSAMDIDDPEVNAALAATPSKSSRRKSAANKFNDAEDNETSSRSLRASGRQRKAPVRYEDEIQKPETPRRPRLPTATPSKAAISANGRRKGRKKVEVEAGESESRSPDVDIPVSRRKSARRSTRKQSENESDTSSSSDEADEAGLEMMNGGMDDSYDPVAAQLHEDLIHDVDGHEETAPSSPLPEYAETFKILCESEFRNEIGALSNIVLEKLTRKRLTPLKGLDAEYQKVHQLVEQTVTAGEGNSMLLMGSRGSGKTTMVEWIISSLMKKHKGDFHVVRLNGFFHTDDRLALREIWRQLGRETDTEDEASKVNSYADTMATLLALLSHPEELLNSADNTNGITTAKSVVIILDEFDLFATHPRQTLLYNLFDIAQARKAPLAVLGLTTKVDVTETLEKRVKSRFSHRYVYLPLARSFEAFSDSCLSTLSVEATEIEDSDFGGRKPVKLPQLLDVWKAYLKSLWEDKDFESHLQRIFHQTKSVKEFYSSALLPISNLYHSASDLESDLEIPTPEGFATQSLTCPDPGPLPFSSSLTGSTSATSLPLSLLLAATRLTALYDPGSDVANSQSLALSFPAAYAEYVRLLTSAKATAAAQGAAATGGRVWGRDISREAWEKLVNWGLVVSLGSRNGTTDGTMFRVEISFEEVADMVGGGGSLGKWWRN